MSFPFIIKEHIIPCSHIREELATTTSGPDHESEKWYMSIKQYTPVSNPEPREGDVSIIGGHGNGFLKELYEPFWTDLYTCLTTLGIRIRSIWVPSTLPSSKSPLHSLNTSHTYSPLSHLDHSRDILHLLNVFRLQIPQPILGIGHSIGASQIAMASVFHPTLFAGLVLLDPIFVPDKEKGNAERLARFAVGRPNEWVCIEEADRWTKGAWREWDGRVRERWGEFALSEMEEGRVRLSWNREREVAAYVQFGYVFPDVKKLEDGDARLGGKQDENKTQDSRNGIGNGKGVVFVNTVPRIMKFLPMMSTHVLILCGEKPGSALPEMREVWRETIASDPLFLRRGMERRVDIETVQATGHLLPLEKPRVCAERAAEWIVEELKGWWEREGLPSKEWKELGNKERERRAKEWVGALKGKL